MKKALVTGITGQDGSYLAELLLEKKYDVVGLKRRTSTNTEGRIKHISSSNFIVEEFEIADSGSVYSAVQRHKPNEIYNLAAQSHVQTSFDQPDYTSQVNTIGVINFLEAIKRFSPSSKFYQASTSEMFGKNVDEGVSEENLGMGKDAPKEFYQDENTAFEPQSPYAAAKLASHHLVRIYREGFGLHASCGILFNHESERRGEKFVTRKITKWIASFVSWAESQGLSAANSNFHFDEDLIHGENSTFPKLRLGNLDAYRDWGHAKDYVRAMWLMLQQEEPEDYVIATGKTFSIRDFLTHAFEYIDIYNYEDFVTVDPKFFRPSEVEFLKGKPDKAKRNLGWTPEISFKQLVHGMLENDINGQEKKTSIRKAVKFIP
jgi:GDPmannose 4,6-dehydratase